MRKLAFHRFLFLLMIMAVAMSAAAQETEQPKDKKKEKSEKVKAEKPKKEKQKKVKEEKPKKEKKEKSEEVKAEKPKKEKTKPDVKKYEFGKGVNVMAKDSSFSMKFSTRIQNLITAGTALDGEINLKDIDAAFLVRRARLKFTGFAYSPKLTYKIELGLSNKDIGGAIKATNNAPNVVLDAVLKWKFYKNFSLWFGQTKLPGNRERLVSSQKLQFVDRSIVNSSFNIDRDLGIQLHHHFSIGKVLVREAAAVSQGEGRNIVTGNQGGIDYTGRIEVLPFGGFAGKGDYIGADLEREEKPKLALGFTYDFNDNAVREKGQRGDFMISERDLQSTMADLMFKYKGISLMAEWVQKTADLPVLYDLYGSQVGAFYTGMGLNVQAGYLFHCNWEVAGRYSQVEPEKVTGRNTVKQYTLGVSKYIVGHNLKVQSDVSYTDEENVSDPELMVRLQVELAF